MLEIIFRRLRALRPSHPIAPLGRWCIKDKTKNNWKIDMANTDHCGTCSYDNQKPVVIKTESITAETSGTTKSAVAHQHLDQPCELPAAAASEMYQYRAHQGQ
jgi:hypothetical protein